MDIERVFLRIEARRARHAALSAGGRCPAGCAAILANDTPTLERWDELLFEQWRDRHGLTEAPIDLASPDAASCGVGG